VHPVRIRRKHPRRWFRGRNPGATLNQKAHFSDSPSFANPGDFLIIDGDRKVQNTHGWSLSNRRRLLARVLIFLPNAGLVRVEHEKIAG
jgi:hypothetical protein